MRLLSCSNNWPLTVVAFVTAAFCCQLIVEAFVICCWLIECCCFHHMSFSLPPVDCCCFWQILFFPPATGWLLAAFVTIIFLQPDNCCHTVVSIVQLTLCHPLCCVVCCCPVSSVVLLSSLLMLLCFVCCPVSSVVQSHFISFVVHSCPVDPLSSCCLCSWCCPIVSCHSCYLCYFCYCHCLFLSSLFCSVILSSTVVPVILLSPFSIPVVSVSLCCPVVHLCLLSCFLHCCCVIHSCCLCCICHPCQVLYLVSSYEVLCYHNSFLLGCGPTLNKSFWISKIRKGLFDVSQLWFWRQAYKLRSQWAGNTNDLGQHWHKLISHIVDESIA